MSRSFASPLTFVALGAAVVLVAALVLSGGSEERAVAPSQPRLAPVGLPNGARDPARRVESVADDVGATPQNAVAVEVPRTREPLAEPALLGAGEKAEMDAYFALQGQVVAEVEGQLRDQARALARACAAQVAGVGDPEFIVSASFDAAGQLVESGVVVPASAGDARELGQCLRGQKLSLRATAPGRSVSVELPLRLP